MGIPGFNSWFSEKHKAAYVPLNKVPIDHIYLDMNSILHTVMRNSKTYDHFHKMLYKRLHTILEATRYVFQACANAQ